MKSYAEYLSLLNQENAVDLSGRDIRLLAGALLDGGVPDLELGALLGSFRTRADSETLLLGMLEALQARITRWTVSAQSCPVSFACYGGSSEMPDLTPLLALLLARFGLPVLMHGPLHALGGVSVALLLRELGVMPCASKEQVARELQEKCLAFAPDTLLAPGLAALLSCRARLGALPLLVNAARLIDPFEGGSLAVVAAESAAELECMQSALATKGMRALLLQGTEGEPYANPYARPRMEYWQCGAPAVLFEEDAAPARRSVALPAAVDVEATASWMRQVLEGVRAVPSPVVNQLAACLFATGYCDDFNQAKALAVIAAAGRRVA
jgi:anthranilate phosphoribosyltransferase